jgi:transcriptional regulator NrdR family protein
MERGLVKCPKCGSIKQLTPESKRTETAVWRRRVCKICHLMWITEEQISPQPRMPTEVWQFTDKEMRNATKHEKKPAQSKPKFDTSALQKLPW